MTLFLLLSVMVVIGLFLWRIRDLRALPRTSGTRLRVRIEAFTGYGRPDHFSVAGRVTKDGGRISALNAEFDLMGIGTKFRRNLRRLLLPAMEGVPLEVVVAGITRETVTDADGRFQVTYTDQPILPPGSTLYSVRLHPSDTRLEAGRAVAQIMIVSPQAPFAVITDVDDTIVVSHVKNKVRMLIHALITSVSDLHPVPGFAALFTALTDTVFYVSGSPINLHDKLHAFLRANRFPIGPIFLTSIGTRSRGDFFRQRVFKIERIRTILQMFPELQFILVGDNGQNDSEIYEAIALEFPGRILTTLIYETISPLQAAKILPLGQHRVANALDAGILLYRRDMIDREGLEAIVREMVLASALPMSFNLNRKLRQIERRERENQRRRFTLLKRP